MDSLEKAEQVQQEGGTAKSNQDNSRQHNDEGDAVKQAAALEDGR